MAEKIRVTFMGTGTSQGVPVIACDCAICTSPDPRDNRLRSSILIETQGKTFSIDAGPDFRQQLLRAKVKKLDAVIFTHEHKDHVAGLDDVRAFNFIQMKEMPVYVTDSVEACLRREFPYIFADLKYPGVPRLDVHKITNIPFHAEGVLFQPIEVMHYKMPVFGYRVGDFTYITDVSHIPDAEMDKIKGSKVVVLSALRKQPHISHFNLDQALRVMEELKPEKGYLTHISHLLGLHEDISKELPNHIELAYDGLTIEI